MTNERLTWEAEAKAEVEYSEKTGLAKKQPDSASSRLGMSMTPLVKQRWDEILTEREKEKLGEVIQDKERQQDMQLLAKRKREDERSARLEKIQEIKRQRLQ